MPLTIDTPKCLMPINGKPLLHYWIETLSANNISEVYINTHYLAEKVFKATSAMRNHCQISVSYEPKLLGTAKTLFAAKDWLGNDDFIVAHADNLCLTNFDEFIAEFQKNDPSLCGTMMTFETNRPEDTGTLRVNQNNIITQYWEKNPQSPSRLANGAVYIFNQSFWNLTAGIEADDISKDLIPRIFKKMNTWHNSNVHIDIGDLKSYQQALEIFEKNR